MPATSVTCPFCTSTLKSKTPIPAGTKVKCPKCSTVITVKADDADEPPPTVAAPAKMIAKLIAPKPAASPQPAPKAAAPKPTAAATPKPAAPKPPAAVTPKPAAPKPAVPKPPAAAKPKPPPVEEEEIVDVDEEEIVDVDEEEIVDVDEVEVAEADEEIGEVTDAIDEEEPVEAIDDEAPARPRKKRAAKGSLFKRLPMWVWLTAGGGLLLVVLVGCGGVILLAWWMFGGPAVTKENFDKIKIGASEQEVLAIMGPPNSSPEEFAGAPASARPISITGSGLKILVWKRGNDFIEVGVVQDKVYVKVGVIGGQLLLS